MNRTPPHNFKPGDRVRHPDYGTGEVFATASWGCVELNLDEPYMSNGRKRTSALVLARDLERIEPEQPEPNNTLQ